MRIAVQMVDSLGVERRGAAFDAVDLIILLQQQVGQERAVLARYAGDQCLHACFLKSKEPGTYRYQLQLP